MARAELHGLSYSPWSEKAKWALDHHRIAYDYREHQLLFGMPLLRWKLGKLRGEVTVPAFIQGPVRLCDSFAIAWYADLMGKGAKLFPPERMEEIQRFNDLSEKALDSIRALVMANVARDREAQAEALPAFVPAFLRRAFAGLASLGLAYLDREFQVRRIGVEQRVRDLREVLLAIRQTLAASGGSYVLGTFTYADIAAAVVLQGVRPVDAAFMSLGPATRRVWTQDLLAREFEDLIRWRDEVYRKHRHE